MTEKVKINSKGREHKVEVAESYLRRAWGLSLRKEGKMLFKFPNSTRTRVDMMLLSKTLHLYFLNQEREVIDVQEAEPWSWDPRTWKLYGPDSSYRYLLESFEDLGLEEGDNIVF